MREIHLNGYIDDEEWFGDEITPEALHGMLYPEGEEAHDDLRILLNSYGGSCNAAVRMFDDLRAIPPTSTSSSPAPRLQRRQCWRQQRTVWK